MKNLALFILLLSFIQHNKCRAFQAELVTTELSDLPGISTTKHNEAVPLLTQDGKRIYFTRTNPRKSGMVTSNPLHEIWYADRNPDGSWTPIKAPRPLNTGLNSAVVGISQETNTIYLFGTYSKFKEDQKGLSYSRYEHDKWTKPKRINIPELHIEGHFYGVYVHSSEQIVLISKEQQGNEDLFVSIKDQQNNWSVPKSLGPVINSSAFEISPFLTEDKKYLFFSRGNEDTDTEVYYAERLDDSWTNWSHPQKLEGMVSSTGFDAYFSIHSDSTVIFSSNRAGTSDIYLSKLRPKSSPAATETVAPDQPVQTNTELSIESILINEGTSIDGDLEFKGIIEGNNLVSGYLFFGFNAYQITDRQKTFLDQVIKKLLDQPDLRISLSGHIDQLENKSTPQKLSEKRAMEVRKYLVSNGIGQQRILLTAHEGLLPIASNNQENGRKLNRRVEINWF